MQFCAFLFWLRPLRESDQTMQQTKKADHLFGSEEIYIHMHIRNLRYFLFVRSIKLKIRLTGLEYAYNVIRIFNVA